MALLTNQAGVLLGPLTETWTMPESCTYYHEQCAACDVAFRGQACASVAGDDEGRPEDNASCWPPVTSGVKEPEAPFYGWGFYSPGIVCPAGYTTACTAVHGENPDWEVQFKPRPGETAVGCCPEGGYACANQNGNTCMALATKSTEMETVQCSGTELTDIGFHALPDVATVTASGDDGSATLRTTTRKYTLLAPMFQLNFQSSDLDSLPKETSPPGETSVSMGGEGQSGEGQEGGLSMGAQIGIGVGVGAAALLGIVVAWLLYRKRKQKVPDPVGSHEEKQGMYPAYAYQTPQPTPELTDRYGTPASELSGRPRTPTSELPVGDGAPVEMPVSSYR